jgi:hypothetical protein
VAGSFYFAIDISFVVCRVLAEEGKGLGTLLVIILLTQKLGAIVLNLTVTVKDATRRYAVASQSLTAPFRHAHRLQGCAPV